MKRLINQFLIISVTFWLVTPLVDLFIDNSPIYGVADYVNQDLIIRSFVMGVVFVTLFNLVVKRYTTDYQGLVKNP